MARTTVVTVTYNSGQTIGPMLEALRPAVAAGVVEVVIVDNASRDDTLAVLAPFERAGVCRVVSGGGNIGFGRGCNVGASHATTEFVLMLNPDARLEPDAIATLERTLDETPDADVAAPAIEQEDGSTQPVDVLPTLAGLLVERSPLHRYFIRPRSIAPGGQTQDTRWVSGAAFLIRRDAITALNGFDPRFFLYYEESDLFRRIRRRSRRILIVPTAICHHIGGHSAHTVEAGRISNCIAEHYIRSRNYYARKHFGLPVMWLTDLAFFATLWFRALTSPRPGDKLVWKARRAVGLFIEPAKVAPSDPGASINPISLAPPGAARNHAKELAQDPARDSAAQTGHAA